MTTYLILNSIVLSIVALLLKVTFKIPSKAVLVTLAALLVLTFIFDNIMITLSLFEYEPSKILGVRLLHAPIEDFMYALLAVLLVPTLWNKLGSKND